MNTTLTASTSSFIRGANSGATGFVNTTVTGTTIILSQTSGSFIPGEEIIINELAESTRTISSVRQYTFEDVKSVYQDTSALISGFIDFSADTVLETTRISSLPSFNNSIISSSDGNTGTITSPGNGFTGI